MFEIRDFIWLAGPKQGSLSLSLGDALGDLQSLSIYIVRFGSGTAESARVCDSSAHESRNPNLTERDKGLLRASGSSSFFGVSLFSKSQSVTRSQREAEVSECVESLLIRCFVPQNWGDMATLLAILRARAAAGPRNQISQT